MTVTNSGKHKTYKSNYNCYIPADSCKVWLKKLITFVLFELKPLIIFVLCSFYCIHQSAAQDFHFSQFYEMPMLRNPALAGVFNGDLRIAAAHRNQWQSVTVPFQTSSACIEYKLPVFNFNDYLTIGAQVVHDVAGDIKLERTQLFPVINFHKSLSQNDDNYLSLAFMGGPVNSQFDPTQARMDDQFINGSFSSSNASRQQFNSTGYSYWDLSTGLTFSGGFGYASNYYIGVGYYHFLNPRINFFNANSNTLLNKKWVFNGGIKSPITDNSRLIGFADYFVQGGHRQFFGGAMFEFDVIEYYAEDELVSLGLGSFYRWNDAIIPVVRLQYLRWNLGISYDANISKLKTASQMRGGFELTASFRSYINSRNSSIEKVRCVKF